MHRRRITLLIITALLLPSISHADWGKRSSRIKAPTTDQPEAAVRTTRLVQASRRPAPGCLEVITPTQSDKPTWACP
ncbi:hypothetical protein ACFPAG_07795 [Vogesella sp. GCM10023246]|uniref:Secreted protein n=1 Tax=Vogesella oryzagri TaxID=3160864 RepID=A0ABV1M2P4_9NEIS